MLSCLLLLLLVCSSCSFSSMPSHASRLALRRAAQVVCLFLVMPAAAAACAGHALRGTTCCCTGRPGTDEARQREDYGTRCASWDAPDEEPWCMVKKGACGDSTFESMPGEFWSTSPCGGKGDTFVPPPPLGGAGLKSSAGVAKAGAAPQSSREQQPAAAEGDISVSVGARTRTKARAKVLTSAQRVPPALQEALKDHIAAIELILSTPARAGTHDTRARAAARLHVDGGTQPPELCDSVFVLGAGDATYNGRYKLTFRQAGAPQWERIVHREGISARVVRLFRKVTGSTAIWTLQQQGIGDLRGDPAEHVQYLPGGYSSAFERSFGVSDHLPPLHGWSGGVAGDPLVIAVARHFRDQCETKTPDLDVYFLNLDRATKKLHVFEKLFAERAGAARPVI